MSSYSFPKGELVYQLALRGLSQREFATKAGLDSDTVAKAAQGKELHPKSWGKILIALGTMPVPEMPTRLGEKTA